MPFDLKPQRKPDLVQPRLGARAHDSCQYHFFCGNLFVAVRVFKTPTLEHHSAWVFDGQAREVMSSTTPLKLGKENHLHLTGPHMEMVVENKGRFEIEGQNGATGFSVEFSPKTSLVWDHPSWSADEQAIHQPDLIGRVRYKGAVHDGIGYCKRYFWANFPRYWGYRFLHGAAADGSLTLWTADAVFGLGKYDYFHIVRKDGSMTSADPDRSSHKLTTMYGQAGSVNLRVDFEPLGEWDTVLKSPRMESHMLQRYGRMVLHQNDRTLPGFAMTEQCFGTLG